ncbi:MAG: GNAT family N-acetyltransferase [Bauldia sp.]|nr:GNAT family N-acetyltransferase [Bauldia sp.]
MRPPSVRAATLPDLDRLLELEVSAFGSDRLSRRSFARLLGAASAASRVIAEGRAVLGYALLLFRSGSRVARLYSLAVDAGHRGRGLAAVLLADAERLARRRGCDRVRLEVRADNPAAIRLYERSGYAFRGLTEGYYADGAAARRYEKRLAAPHRGHSLATKD